jgi:hypothetical protein
LKAQAENLSLEENNEILENPEEENKKCEDNYIPPVPPKSSAMVNNACVTCFMEFGIAEEDVIVVGDTVYSNRKAYFCYHGCLNHRLRITDSKCCETAAKYCPIIRNSLQGVRDVATNFVR